MENLVDTSKMSSNDAKLALSNAMQTKVLGIQTMDLSVFGGIIVGIVVYFVHKWAVKVQLPTSYWILQRTTFRTYRNYRNYVGSCYWTILCMASSTKRYQCIINLHP